jgi:hypothetical protein
MLLNDCISDLTFDAWRAGEIDRARERVLDEHVRTCASCLSRRRALEAHADAFERRPDRALPLQAVRAKLKRRKRGKQLASLTAVAIAASCLLIFEARNAEPPPDGRLKGGSSVGFYVRRGEQVFRWQPGQAVHPGDQLRFTWRSLRPVYLAIFSLDARGAASIYFPTPDAPQQRVAGGDQVDLPLAVQLDDTLGAERVYALGCESPPVLESLRRSLEKAGELQAPAACELLQLSLFKEPRP